MPGHMIATGPCWACDKVIAFNPDRVPSIHGHPVCRECIEMANEERAKIGQEPIIIYEDSYE